MADVARHQPSAMTECDTVLQFRRNFGLNVRRLRAATGLTKGQVAAHLEIPTRDVSRIERGDIACSLNVLAKLAAVINTDIAQLMMSEPALI